MLYEHLHVCIIDHRQLLYVLLHTHRQCAQSYHNIINYTIISLYIVIKHNSAYVTYYVHYSHHPLEDIAHTMH